MNVEMCQGMFSGNALFKFSILFSSMTTALRQSCQERVGGNIECEVHYALHGVPIH